MEEESEESQHEEHLDSKMEEEVDPLHDIRTQRIGSGEELGGIELDLDEILAKLKQITRTLRPPDIQNKQESENLD